ncbi:hypothetical protein [Runella sp.]|uniref:hypothetical protein n=1 Tax=Runella sp. TaxID=1960881 RepID=UPI003D10E189
MNLTNNARYRVRNLAFSKYIKPNADATPQLGHYTYNANDILFEFIAVETVLLTTTYYKLKSDSNKYWTVPNTGDGPLTLQNDLGLTDNAFFRQCFQLIEVSAGVVMLAPRSAPNARVQLAGPLPDEGRYIQLFSFQVNSSAEQFAFELVSSLEVVDKPVIRKPIYSHHTQVFVENIEAGASIQLLRDGLAFGPQRPNSTAGTITIEIPITGLAKGGNFKADAFKTGESPTVADTVTVEEAAIIVKVKEPSGTFTFNLEVGEVVSGTTTDNAQAQRFNPPKILQSGLTSLGAAEAARATAKYTKTKTS